MMVGCCANRVLARVTAILWASRSAYSVPELVYWVNRWSDHDLVQRCHSAADHSVACHSAASPVLSSTGSAASHHCRDRQARWREHRSVQCQICYQTTCFRQICFLQICSLKLCPLKSCSLRFYLLKLCPLKTCSLTAPCSCDPNHSPCLRVIRICSIRRCFSHSIRYCLRCLAVSPMTWDPHCAQGFQRCRFHEDFLPRDFLPTASVKYQRSHCCQDCY